MITFYAGTKFGSHMLGSVIAVGTAPAQAAIGRIGGIPNPPHHQGPRA
jgi:hypothetical protein